MRKHLLPILTVALLAVGLVGPTAAAGPVAVKAGSTGMTPAQRLAKGPLPKNAAAYAKAKAQAKLASAANQSVPRSGTMAPSTFIEWEGVKDEGVTPSDSTGAIGPTRYIELVNLNFSIYDRSAVQLSTGTLNALGGRPETDFIFDPQVIWDPQTQRFYYVMDDVIGNFANSLLAYGWSKTDTPTTPADFCHFTFDYPGDHFPDYPKLGDSFNWGLVGVNTFDPPGFGFVSSDVMWFRKPPPGPNCNQPFAGVTTNLRDQTGTGTFTPVPAQTTDQPLLTLDGVILSNDPYDPGEQNFLTRYTVRNGLAGPIIENPGRAIPIPAYQQPPPADQPGMPASIDTLDGRLTQGVEALDPRFALKPAVWTQHTVLGGAGAQVRWYEVDPVGLTLFQSGVATDTLLDVFNGAISPDRANNGSSQAYGSNMVMGFNTSSSIEFVKIQMVSKIGGGAQSGFVLVEASLGENFDHSCTPVCRWGDYASATPDPAAPQNAATGQVWLTSMFNDDSPPGNSDTDWRTRNWGATP